MSAYAELPSEREGERKSKVEAAVGRAERIAGELGDGIGNGLRDASQAIVRSQRIDESLLDGTDLPEIEGDDALLALATRLDREGDLWRRLAFREITQARWTTRALLAAAAVFVTGTLALAVLAAIDVLFGGGAGSALLVGVGAAALLGGLLGLVALASSIRRAHRELLRDALARSDLAELRLHRIAIALAARAADPTRAGEILARLERDVRD